MPPHTASVTPLRTIIVKAVTAAVWETEIPDGYFLKRRCRLWEITPDSQRLTKYAAHLDCFKPGQMCIIPTQHPDIQQLSHRHCTSTSKTFRHNLPPRAVSTTAAFSTIHCRCGTGRNDECGSERPWWRCAFPATSTTAAFSTIHCHCGTGRNDECGSKRPWWRCAFPAASTTAAFHAIHCHCGRK